MTKELMKRECFVYRAGMFSSFGRKDDPGDRLGPEAIARSKHKCRQHAKEIFEHNPRELHISVNGHVLLEQPISSASTQHVLKVSLDESIAFAEVLSEQGKRLLLLIVTPPPVGLAEQSARVSLSHGRTLELSMSFDGPWPNLRVAYHDLAFSETRSRDSVRFSGRAA